MSRICCTFLFAFTFLFTSLNAQSTWPEAVKAGSGTLEVFYHNEYPYAYEEDGELRGLEIEIIREFAAWVKLRKEVDLTLEFKGFEEFSEVYQRVKQGECGLGAASTTITKDREEEIIFSEPYLRNASVLVTSMDVPVLESYNEIPAKFEGKVALVREGTTHEEELKKIKAFHHPDMIVRYVQTTDEMLKLLTESGDYYAMVDLITYWRFVKKENAKLRLQRIATVKNESFGFIFPKDCTWQPVVNEFFTKGFGFTSSEQYNQILEKYLGPEVIETIKAD